IAGPEIVFLDEPLAALDSPTRERMMQELPVLLKGRAAMLVTHDHGEARRLAQRVAVMLDGKVVQQGAVEDVFLRPASLELAKFLGVENLVPARREGELVVFPSGLEWRCDEKSRASGDVVVCLRAESVTVGLAQAHPDDVCLRGRITAAQPRAVGLAVWVSLPGFTLEARAWPGGSQRTCLELGAEIDVHFHRKLVHLVSLQPQ
ncbi:MAG: hypothetical protein MUC50_19505, partial [Myxococcota bacterium]|nr:hypothetical protein [Myxococcota bacterium]